MKKIFYLALMLALTACASPRGFDRGALRGQVSEKVQISEEDIKKALELKPQLPNPFRLAVYFSPGRYGWYSSRWDWRKEDKDQLAAFAEALKKNGVVSEAVFLTDDMIEATKYDVTNRDIRLGAARAGADAVLILRGTSDIDKYNNILGVTYVLLLPMFFSQGTVVDAYFIANATMWDVRNQYLYMSVEADGTASQTRPTFFVEEKDVVMLAKAQAMKDVVKELTERMQKLLGK